MLYIFSFRSLYWETDWLRKPKIVISRKCSQCFTFSTNFSHGPLQSKLLWRRIPSRNIIFNLWLAQKTWRAEISRFPNFPSANICFAFVHTVFSDRCLWTINIQHCSMDLIFLSWQFVKLARVNCNWQWIFRLSKSHFSQSSGTFV